MSNDIQEIVLAPQPRGVFEEGYVSSEYVGTLKPGQFVQIDVSMGKDADGRWQYEPRADAAAPIAIIAPQYEWGHVRATAYNPEDPIRVYFPAPGEHLNALIADATGTGDLHTAGLYYDINSAGKLVDASSGDEKFQILEDLDALEGDTLAEVLFCRP